MFNAKRLTLLLFVLLTIQVKAQILTYSVVLGMNENQTKEYMKQTLGTLKFDKKVGQMFDVPSAKLLFYSFPISQIEKNGTYSAWFLFNKRDICFEYIIWYRDESFLNAILEQLNNKQSKFIHIGKDLTWKKGNMQLDISKITSTDSSRKSAFSLRGKLINYFSN